MIELDDQALDLVARTMLGEAGNDPAGMQAVANVIRNRTRSGVWGSEMHIGPTLFAPKQFSTWNPHNPVGDRVRATATSDPNYQRAAQIAQAVWRGQLGDNTKGATHFYNPALAAPDWAAQGTNVSDIGGQRFMTVPWSPGSTAGTGTTGPSSASLSTPYGYGLSGGMMPQSGDLDLDHLDPVFAQRIQKLQADAAAAGIQTKIISGYRDYQNQAGLYKKYQAGGNIAAPAGRSYHNFGRAVDLVASNPAQQQALIAMARQPERGLKPGADFGDPAHFQTAERLDQSLGGPGVPANTPFTPAVANAAPAARRRPAAAPAPPQPPPRPTTVGSAAPATPPPRPPEFTHQMVSTAAPSTPGSLTPTPDATTAASLPTPPQPPTANPTPAPKPIDMGSPLALPAGATPPSSAAAPPAKQTAQPTAWPATPQQLPPSLMPQAMTPPQSTSSQALLKLLYG